MPRTKRSVAAKARKKVRKAAKGYWGARSKVYTVAKHHVEKGLLHAYRDRKFKKRTYRQLWITRINAAARENGITYSKLINASIPVISEKCLYYTPIRRYKRINH